MTPEETRPTAYTQCIKCEKMLDLNDPETVMKHMKKEHGFPNKFPPKNPRPHVKRSKGKDEPFTREELDKLQAEERARSKSPKSKKREIKDPVSEVSEVDPTVWQAVHIYQREGETEHNVRYAAQFERKERGPSVLIFAHVHNFGQPCSEKCKEKN